MIEFYILVVAPIFVFGLAFKAFQLRLLWSKSAGWEVGTAPQEQQEVEFDAAALGAVPIPRAFAEAAIGGDPGSGDFYVGIETRRFFGLRWRRVKCYRYRTGLLCSWEVFELHDHLWSRDYGFVWAVLPDDATLVWVGQRLEVVDFQGRRNASFDFEVRGRLGGARLVDITATDGVVSINVAGPQRAEFWVSGHAYDPLRGGSLDLEVKPGARIGIINRFLPGRYNGSQGG